MSIPTQPRPRRPTRIPPLPARLLLGCADVAASKAFYVERGLVVGKSYGRKYVDFTAAGSPIGLALLGRKALAKDAGVAIDRGGFAPDRLIGDGSSAVDPDGFGWEATHSSATTNV